MIGLQDSTSTDSMQNSSESACNQTLGIPTTSPSSFFTMEEMSRDEAAFDPSFPFRIVTALSHRSPSARNCTDRDEGVDGFGQV